MNNTYITKLQHKKVFTRKASYNPKYNHKRMPYHRKAPSWVMCKQTLTNRRGLYLKHVYGHVSRIIIHKYMHVLLVWWYILSQRYLQLVQHLQAISQWCEYYYVAGNLQPYVLQNNARSSPAINKGQGVVNSYRWAITQYKGKKRGWHARKRIRRGGFFRIRKHGQSYGRYLPPKQYALLKAFYAPSSLTGWEDKFTLPVNLLKVRRMITHLRKGVTRKRYLFINVTAFTVRSRSNSYLYYTNIKQNVGSS